LPSILSGIQGKILAEAGILHQILLLYSSYSLPDFPGAIFWYNGELQDFIPHSSGEFSDLTAWCLLATDAKSPHGSAAESWQAKWFSPLRSSSKLSRVHEPNICG